MKKFYVLNKREPIRRRPSLWRRAMAGQAQKRSPALGGGMSIYFKEAHNAAIGR